jgi:hypothetical protein
LALFTLAARESSARQRPQSNIGNSNTLPAVILLIVRDFFSNKIKHKKKNPEEFRADEKNPEEFRPDEKKNFNVVENQPVE